MAGRPPLISWQSFDTLKRAMWAPDEALSAEEAASTLFRFFRSKHVVDLKLIVTVAWASIILYAAAVILIFVFMYGIYLWHTLFSGGMPPPPANAASQIISSPPSPPSLLAFLAYIGPSISLGGAIAAWAYLSAATRLGIVDLFACEISTLCRLGTIADSAKRLVDRLDAASPQPAAAAEKRTKTPGEFVSQEEYFPIFSNNSKDLEALEALVVRHITEFYTYLKATRDSLRKLVATDPAQVPAGVERAELVNVIYMLFLCYEAGRKSVKDLIEFQPAAAETAIVILISELKCYGALRQCFEEDNIRFKRLDARTEAYQSEIPEVFRRVWDRQKDGDWKPAYLLLSELDKRYYDVFGQHLAASEAQGEAGAPNESGRARPIPVVGVASAA